MSGGPVDVSLFEVTALRVRAVVRAFAVEQEAVLAALPGSVVADLAAGLAVGYLVGAGVVVAAPAGEPGAWRAVVPPQFQPDVGQMVAGYRRLLDALLEGE